MKYSDPPLLSHLDEDEICQVASNGLCPDEWKSLPCHTQQVERHIKLVSSAGTQVCGSENRDGVVRATLASCSMMPSFETKADFNA